MELKQSWSYKIKFKLLKMLKENILALFWPYSVVRYFVTKVRLFK